MTIMSILPFKPAPVAFELLFPLTFEKTLPRDLRNLAHAGFYTFWFWFSVFSINFGFTKFRVLAPPPLTPVLGSLELERNIPANEILGKILPPWLKMNKRRRWSYGFQSPFAASLLSRQLSINCVYPKRC